MGGVESLYLVLGGETPWLVLLVGRGSRAWIEPLYASAGFAPMGRLWAVLPRRPGDPLAVLDACLAFLPEHFAGCPSLDAARAAVGDAETLDLAGPTPEAWRALRAEAASRWAELRVLRSGLEPWTEDPYGWV